MSLKLYKHLVPSVQHGLRRFWVRPLAVEPLFPSSQLAKYLTDGLGGRSWSQVGQRKWQSTLGQHAPAIVDQHEDTIEIERTGTSLTACPGCGALAQTVAAGEAGFYSNKRRAVTSYTKSRITHSDDSSAVSEEDIAEDALKQADPQLLHSLGLQQTGDIQHAHTAEHPLCDRCHHLIHHHVGVPIAHPSIDSIHDTISESPYKYNHIYHVLDAADFPLSLIPKIHRFLSISEQRSKNRRSKHARFRHGKITEMSFIITRSDLLAPKKEQVDSLMPYFIQVLRDALGSVGENVRLGNVRCVSAKRGWWTKELKADIWDRGGGGWMVGKVNVGKSHLFEVVFPKGRSEDINFDAVRRKTSMAQGFARLDLARDSEALADTVDDHSTSENYLLPPARLETPYPTMPTISSLPGTTASPIRIPFGNGKGELIDLPGVSRGNLDAFVREEDRDILLMNARITPEQYVIKPGQSLLLGGLIRITPTDPDTVILAYPFVPLRPHLTNTEKAIILQTGALPSSGVPRLVADETAHSAAASAGTFELKWDVTRQRAGPLTSGSAGALKPSSLPFKVLSADLLIEGVGWVELVAQVRKKKSLPPASSPPPDQHPSTSSSSSSSSRRLQHISSLNLNLSTTTTTTSSPPASPPTPQTYPAEADEPTHYPTVEVFSPQGKFVGIRRPMGAWLLGGGQGKPGKGREKGRPRRSMASLRGSRRAGGGDGE